jgi:hypothetical protein
MTEARAHSLESISTNGHDSPRSGNILQHSRSGEKKSSASDSSPRQMYHPEVSPSVR